MLHYYPLAWKRALDFRNRARRTEYGVFQLVNFVISLALIWVDAKMNTYVTPEMGTFQLVFAAIVFVPSLAVAVRRIHDVGHTGWWLLLVIIPFVGIIVFIALLFMEGEAGPNAWGPDPRGDPMDPAQLDA